MAGDILKFLIEVDSDTATAKVKRFNEALNETGKAGATAANRTNDAFATVERKLTAFSSTTMALGRTLSVVLTAPIALAGAIGISFNALQEQAKIAFTTMLGGAQQATAMLSTLKDFAARTPFEFPDLLRATQRMMAYGFSAREVLPTLTAIGDAAAALGGSAETIQRVTTALGQMRAKGTVQAEEMRQLAEAGIPAWELLAKKIGVSIPEAMKMVEQRSVSAAQGIAALVEGINQRFGGMMEKQAHTWTGLISTIKDESRFLAGALTEGVFNALKGPLEAATNRLHEFRVAMEKLPDAAKLAVAGVAAALAGLGPALYIFGALAGSLNNLIQLYKLFATTAVASTAVQTGAAVARQVLLYDQFGQVITTTAAAATMATARTGLLARAIGMLGPAAMLAGKAIGIIGTIYLAKQISDAIGLTAELKNTAVEAAKLAFNLGRAAATSFSDLLGWLKQVASELKAMTPEWVKFLGSMAQAQVLAPLRNLNQGFLRPANEILGASAQTPPAIQERMAALPPEHRAALMANENAMRAGVPKNVQGDNTPDKLFQQQVDNIVKSVIREANESKALDAALQKLQAAHVPLVIIAEKLGDQIRDNAQLVQALGGKVSAARQEVLDFLDTNERLAASNQRVSESIDRSDGSWIDMVDAITQATEGVAIWDNRVGMMVGGIDAVEAAVVAANEALTEHVRLLEESNFLREQQKPIGQLLMSMPNAPMAIGGIDSTSARQQAISIGRIDIGAQLNELRELPHVLAGILQAADPKDLPQTYNVMRSEIEKVDELLKKNNITLTEQEKATLAAAIAHTRATEAAEQFEKQMGRAFADIIADVAMAIAQAAREASNFGAAITAGIDTAVAKFGDALSASIVLSLSRPLMMRFQNLGEKLAEKFDGLSEIISSKLGGAVGKVLGDKAGKLIGGIIGDVAGALAGAAIGAAVSAISGAIGKGRRTANEFVQGSQNAFGREFGSAVDDFWKSFGSGELTKGEAMQARGDLTKMWEDFQQSAAEFAAKGGTEAKVAMQALATLSPVVAAALRDIDGVIDDLGDTAKKSSIEFQRAVEALNSSITSFADNADVLEEAIHRAIERGVPMSLIIDALGRTVESTVNQLRELGMEIPPNIEAVSKAMETMGETAEKTASEFETAVERMLGSITSFADNADVLEESIKRAVEKGVPISLIVDVLGNTIEQTVKQLKALGIDVPPWIAAAAAEMANLEKNTKAATTALKAGPNAVELVKMQIEAYNEGFNNARIGRRATQVFRPAEPQTTERIAVGRPEPMETRLGLPPIVPAGTQGTQFLNYGTPNTSMMTEPRTAVAATIPTPQATAKTATTVTTKTDTLADAATKLMNAAEMLSKAATSLLELPEKIVKALSRMTSAEPQSVPEIPGAVVQMADSERWRDAVSSIFEEMERERNAPPPPPKQEAVPVVTMQVTYEEGDINISIPEGTPVSEEDILEHVRRAMRENRKNFQRDIVKSVKDAWLSEGRRI